MGAGQRWRSCSESEGEAWMNNIEKALRANAQVTDYKINMLEKQSCELFFVKGKLETVRCTDTCDKDVTVYVTHDNVIGSAQFFVYPSTTEKELFEKAQEAVNKALLMQNQPYSIPGKEEGSYTVESNFNEKSLPELAEEVADIVFCARSLENSSLNSVEIFINKFRDSIVNSKGLNKTQVRYTAMVETIPTYNGTNESVELYHQYNFSNLDPDELKKEIHVMLEAAHARYQAVKPDTAIDCKVILGTQELSQLLGDIARNLEYSSVYTHSGVFHKGDHIQKKPDGDKLNITMAGAIPGCISSAMFDSDGLSLGEIQIVAEGNAINYFGSNRFGQYVGENPTGNLRCLRASTGNTDDAVFQEGPYLEVISMSGLQLDFFSDYIGGEVRLAYYHNGSSIIPITGISISGQISDVLNHIRLSKNTVTRDSYHGPEKAILYGMKIY